LDRKEAVKLFKEVSNSCNLDVTSISLVPQINDSKSVDYQLHIRTFLSNCEKMELQAITTTHQLAWKEENGNIVIYKPLNKIISI
jgi:hypothetical protein